MKKIYGALTAITLCGCMALTACDNPTTNATYAMEEIVEAYADTSYEVQYWDYTLEEYSYEYDYYVVISKDSEEEAFFYIFDDSAQAEAYKKKQEWNVLLWLFSVIHEDPTWIRCERYGNVVVQYEDYETIKPFREIEK